MQIRFLNLGCGVQSTTIFLMDHERLIEPIDYSGFADTQEETRAVYSHLAWLQTVSQPASIILIGTAGRIGDDLLRTDDSHERCASIPAYTAPGEPDEVTKTLMVGCEKERRKVGMLRRQCTTEYKTQVIERLIRHNIFKLRARQRFPKGSRVTQLFGISTDEKDRAVRISRRVNETGWATAEFPLLDLKMSRDDCLEWLKTRVPHQTPESSCVFCPFHDAESWLQLKRDPEAWARAVEVDAGLRQPGVMATRALNQTLYLHRSAIPLPLVDLEAEANKDRERKRRPLFDMMCDEGMCGK